MFLIPAVSAGTISFVINITAKALSRESSKVKKISAAIDEATGTAAKDAEPPPADAAKPGDDTVNISIGNGPRMQVAGPEKNMRTRVTDAVLESLLQVLLLPIQIIATSFTAIIVALLYLKTRQAGGESLQDLLEKFEETDRPRKKWQERVRQRLIQSGRLTTSTSKP